MKQDNYYYGYNRGKTRLGNRRTMAYSSLRKLVERPAELCGIYRTIKASNLAGNTGDVFDAEEIEELESRGINPYWDSTKFRNELTKHAKQNRVWLDRSYLKDKTLIHDYKEFGTSENDIYRNPDGKTLTKLNNLSYVKSSAHECNLYALIDRFLSHNTLFPGISYKIKGFMENKHGNPSLVLKQSIVDAERNATLEVIGNYLAERGFQRDGLRAWSNGHFVWSNGVYEFFDARPANVLTGKDGNLFFIDSIVHSVAYIQGVSSEYCFFTAKNMQSEQV